MIVKNLEYRSYQGQYSYDDEAGLFHGEVMGLTDVVTFQSRDIDQLQKAFEESIDVYEEFRASKS